MRNQVEFTLVGCSTFRRCAVWGAAGLLLLLPFLFVPGCPDNFNDPTGACCLSSGICQVLDPVSCSLNTGATYLGDGVACDPEVCQGVACCLPSGMCELLTLDECALRVGLSQPEGSTCETVTCLTGACCPPSGVCSILTEDACGEAEGTYQGDGTVCLSTNCPQEPTTLDVDPGPHETVTGTEAITIFVGTGTFGLTGGTFAIAAGKGTAVHDLSDGKIVFDFRDTKVELYKAVKLTMERATERVDSIFANGPQGFADRPFIQSTGMFGFTFLGAIGRNITDVDLIANTADPTLTDAVLICDDFSGDVLRVTPSEFGGFDETTVLPGTQIAMAGVTGTTVSIHPSDDGSRFVGATETDLFYFDGAAVSALGAVGTGLRLLDCDAGICSVADFTAGEVLTFRWNGVDAPDVGDLSRVSVTGAVGVDVQEDGKVLVPSSDTHTVHRIEFGASLEVVDDTVCSVATTGAGPFHAASIPGTELVIVDHNEDGTFSIEDFASCP